MGNICKNIDGVLILLVNKENSWKSRTNKQKTQLNRPEKRTHKNNKY